jgi:hypothetical protein
LKGKELFHSIQLVKSNLTRKPFEVIYCFWLDILSISQLYWQIIAIFSSMPLSKLASVKSIVLIELYLEPSSILLKPASDRIRTDYTMTGPVFFTGFALFSGKGHERIWKRNTEIFTVSHGILHFRRIRRGLLAKLNSAIDRAHRVLLGANVGLTGASSRANPEKKYWDFHWFSRY